MAVLVTIHVDKGNADLWRDGERDRAFEEMYRRWHQDVVALCHHLLGRVGDAEAAAQETFVRAWLARDRYSPARPFWPWLAVIARRLCLDHRRRFVHEQRWMGQSVLEHLNVSPEVVIEASEDLRIVFRAIHSLRPVERRTLMLRELDGWSYREIASFEGVTVESVRGSLKRARASLRRAVSA